MNLHIPQSIRATVECSTIMAAENHIVTEQRNAPICGLVQDGLVGCRLLTKFGTMVSKEIAFDCWFSIEEILGVEKQENRFSSFCERALFYWPDFIVETKSGYTLAPEIPGKLFISYVLPKDFCYTKKTDEGEVKIEHGIVLPSSGPFGSKIVGAVANSIVHILWLEYSPRVCQDFISQLETLVDKWLPSHGFSMGISDCLIESREEINRTLNEMNAKYENIQVSSYEPLIQELKMNGELNDAMSVGPKIANTCINKGEKNAMNLMRKSGAKGSTINCAQICAFVGQQNIDGQRIPPRLAGDRCLPSFDFGENTPASRGFIYGNYLDGLSPTEAFFHAMAGRRGLIDTAIKSVTGNTPIVILENGDSKRVLIGDWIDCLLEQNKEKVQHFEERELELLELKSTAYIPTVDEDGNVSWGKIKNVTRHDPGKQLYKIHTLGGREVTITESKSLLIWNEKREKFLRMSTPEVKVGDFVPVTMNLVDSPEETTSIDLTPDGLCPFFGRKFHLDEENGFFIGLFLAGGHLNIRKGCISIDIGSDRAGPFLAGWFKKYKIKYTQTTLYVQPKSSIIKGYCNFLVLLLEDWVGGSNDASKFVLNEAFSAPRDFVLGCLKGFFSQYSVLNDSVQVRSVSQRLLVGINMLLSRVGIFGKVASLRAGGLIIENNLLSISGSSAIKFYKLVHPPSEGHRVWIYTTERQKNDVVLDKIVSIEKVDVGEYPKVYDLTVPSTLNFGLANGLHVVDTADTGYIQKKIAKKIEDFNIHIDGSVRDSSLNVIQFLYGGDGLNPKMLYYVKGIEYPFFVDCFNVAKKLTSKWAQNRAGPSKRSWKIRHLTNSEIKYIFNKMSLHTNSKGEYTRLVLNNIKVLLLDPLKKTKIVEAKIEEFQKIVLSAFFKAQIEYGEMVGQICAACIGEPATQLTLNSFHFTGFAAKDVTLGIPRLNELLNATKNPSKPTCTIYFEDQTIKDLLSIEKTLTSEEEKMALNLKCYNLMCQKKNTIELIKISSLLSENHSSLFYTTDLIPPISPIEPNDFLKQYVKEWWFVSYCNFYNISVDLFSKWVIRLQFNPQSLYVYRVTLPEIIQKISETFETLIKCIPSPDNLGIIDVFFDQEKLVPYFLQKLKLEKISDFSVGLIDDDNAEYFIARDLIGNAIQTIQIRGISGIKKAIPRKDTQHRNLAPGLQPGSDWVIDTKGSNFFDILNIPGIDFKRTYSDNIWQIYSNLGIEATRYFLIREIKNVVGFDGTYVNPRHFFLLVDAMTHTGTVTSYHRDGISREVGPCAKISFEKAVDNAMESSMFGEVDHMNGFSANIMFGKLIKGGTGAVSVCKK